MHRLRWRTKRTKTDPLGDRMGLGREVVYATSKAELRALLGLGSDRDLRPWLIAWRQAGLLLHDEGRLTKRVAFHDPSHTRAVRHHRMVVLRFDPRDARALARVRPDWTSREVTPPV